MQRYKEVSLKGCLLKLTFLFYTAYLNLLFYSLSQKQLTLAQIETYF